MIFSGVFSVLIVFIALAHFYQYIMLNLLLIFIILIYIKKKFKKMYTSVLQFPLFWFIYSLYTTPHFKRAGGGRTQVHNQLKTNNNNVKKKEVNNDKKNINLTKKSFKILSLPPRINVRRHVSLFLMLFKFYYFLNHVSPLKLTFSCLPIKLYFNNFKILG